jgi:glycosyltransferase involved in cell wall biosynthesis
MRLLLAGAVFRPEWTGGEPWTARALARGFRDRGHEVETRAGTVDAASMVSMAASPFDWDLVRVAAYVRQIREAQPDVVVGFYDYDSSLCQAARVAGRPFVSIVHIYWPLCPIGTRYIDGVGPCSAPALTKCLRHMSLSVPNSRLPLRMSNLPPPAGLLAYLKLRHRREVLGRASAIVVLSQRMADLMRGAGYDRLSVVHSGVDLGEISPRDWPTATPRTVLLPSTSQSERKGTQEFVRVAARVRGRRGDVRFVATNYSPENGSVDGTPFLSRSAVLEQYARAYCVVAPVLWEEPFGLTAVEAMASGRPVIAYDSGALPELVEDGVTGLIVPRGDTAALERAVERLLDDEPLARRMGAAGRRRVEERFTLPQMVDGYLAVIGQVARAG